MMVNLARDMTTRRMDPEAEVNNDEVPELLFSRDNRQALVTASLRLLSVFDASERTHRQQFGLGGSKMPLPEAQIKYRDLMVQIRQFTLGMNQAPAARVSSIVFRWYFAS
jgi:hypothetical protein